LRHGGVIVTDADLCAEFFDLRTGFAGDVLQRFVNYRAKLAIVLADPAAHGQRFGELVYEHKTHPHVRFFASEELFRLSGAVKRDSAVERWLTAGPVELRSIAQRWFERARQCGNDVRELLHDGCPTACVEDAAFLYVSTFKNHVNVGFFCGAVLEDPTGLLEGSGKRMRHVKLAPDRESDAAALGDLIDTAYRDIKARLDAERAARNG
jgi:hypothetical protein